MSEIYSTLFKAAPYVKEYIEDPGINSAMGIADSVYVSKYFEIYYDELSKRPEIESIVKERYYGNIPSITELLTMPEGSLGYLYGKLLDDYNIEQHAIPFVDVNDDKSYLMQRARITHDIFHVVLGVPPTMPGELAIQGFQVAQLGTPVSKVLACLAFLRTLDFRESLHEYLDPLINGYAEGRRSKLLLSQRWEDGFERPVEEWRQELNLKSISLTIE